MTSKTIVFDDWPTATFEMCNKIAQTDHPQGRVCLLCRHKVRVDTHMDLDRVILKPAAASYGKVRRLRYLGEPEPLNKEAARLRFSPGGHGELHMVDRGEEHAEKFARTESTAQLTILRTLRK